VIAKIRNCPLVIALLVLPVGIGQAADTDEGEALYKTKQCWQCHGYAGQGGPAARIAPTHYPLEVFARLVRHPNLMPAYSPNVLSDEQLQKIYEYVRSIPEPPRLEDIPELN
jgi:mono/diheme cytochrome c family protein